MKATFQNKSYCEAFNELAGFILHVYQVACSTDRQFRSGKKLILDAFGEYNRQYMARSGRGQITEKEEWNAKETQKSN